MIVQTGRRSPVPPPDEKRNRLAGENGRPRKKRPADWAFCACTCAQTVRQSILGGETSRSLVEPATLSRLRIGDGILAADQAMPFGSTRQARDGSALWWGRADTPGPPQIVAPGVGAPILAAVSPMRPGHSIAVEYRLNGGPVREAIGVLEPRFHEASARIFRAVVPGQSDGLVEFLPVLRFAGQPISARLLESEQPSRYQVGSGATPVATPATSPPQTTLRSPDGGRWRWEREIPWRRDDQASQGSGRRRIGRLADHLAF